MCKLPTISMFFRLSGIVAMCAIVVTPLDTVAADEPPLSAWAPTDTRREPDASLFPSRQDIFQGATDRPAIGLPSSMGGQMPSAGNFFDSGKSNAAANIGSAARNAKAGDQLGAFQAVGAGGSRSPSGLGAVGQVVGGAGGAVRQVANTVQAGAQVVRAVGAVNNMVDQFRQGGSGFQNASGQGLGGNVAGGILGNGIGAGPFGQFGGQNNQVLQGLQFVALLQQLFATFFPSDSAMQFNNANTGQSARAAFANLMGANSSGVDGVPPVSPITAVPCSNGQKDRTKPFNELNASPATQVQLTKLCVKEVGSQGEDAQVALYETLFNRSTAEGNSIDRAMHNGYYEPINKGTVDSVSTSSSEYASCERALNRALAGSNTIGCRRHAATNCAYAKGFGGDPNSCVTIGGEAFYSKPGESCSGNFC